MNATYKNDVLDVLRKDISEYKSYLKREKDNKETMRRLARMILDGFWAEKVLDALDNARVAGISKRKVVLDILGLKSASTLQYDNLVRKLRKELAEGDKAAVEFRQKLAEIKGEN